MRALQLAVLAAATTLSSACATLLAAGPAPVQFQTDTPGADVYVDGAFRGKTPLMLNLDKNRSHAIVFKQPGRRDLAMDIGTKVRGQYVVLDVLGGILPVAVDAVTGEWKTLNTNLVTGNLLPAAP